MLSVGFYRKTIIIAIYIHITAAPSSAPASSKSHVTEGKNTQNKKKGETHQKVELIFQKVSGGLVIEPLVP